MSTMWSPDTCKCKVVLDPNGKALGFKNQCELHKNSKAEDVIEDNRYKNKQMNIIARELEVDHSKITFERNENSEFVFSVTAPEGKKVSINKLLEAQGFTAKVK